LKQNDFKYILVVLGRLHARKGEFRINNEKFIPIASHFKQKAISINMRYGIGTIYNFKEKRINDPYAKKITSKKESFFLRKSKSIYFDYDLFLRKSKKADMI